MFHSLITTGFVQLLTLANTAQAAGSNVICTLVTGSCGPENTALDFLLPMGRILLYIVGGLCVLYSMWGGLQMILSYGDDGKITQGRNSIIYAMFGLAFALISNSLLAYVNFHARNIVSSAGASSNQVFIEAIGEAAVIILEIYRFALVMAVVVAGFRYVISRGKEDESEAAKKMLIWAVVGAVAINLAKTLATIVLNIGL